MHKRTTTLLFLLTLTCICPTAAFAQSSSPPARPRYDGDPNLYYRAPSTIGGKTVLMPVGTTFEGRIDQTISSTHSHPGQSFNIVIASPVLINGTDVAIPPGSKVTGEIVEAVPASHVSRRPGEQKFLIRGKLRIAISGLQTPSGVTYPLVASVTGEVEDMAHGGGRHSMVGQSVGYMGSSASFETVAPGMQNKGPGRSGTPRLMAKEELMRDPIYGRDFWDDRQSGHNKIRSLVLVKRDYYIYEGSPLVVRINAPFKIGITPPGLGAPMGQVNDTPVDDVLPPPSARQSFESPQPPTAQATQNPGNGNIAPGNQGVVPADSF